MNIRQQTASGVVVVLLALFFAVLYGYSVSVIAAALPLENLTHHENLAHYERILRPGLPLAFVASWLCLSVLALLLMFQARGKGHYKTLSEIDHLTGAGNRMAFEKHMEHVGSKGRFPLCLIVIDVDGLKTINDKIGHQAGDALLCRVAVLLRRSLRDNDAIYRIGGDEFAVIIPGAIYSVAEPLMERLDMQAALMREKVDMPPAFVSCGLAEARDKESFVSLFMRADAAMYNKKQMRRDAVHKSIAEWVKEHPAYGDRRKTPPPF